MVYCFICLRFALQEKTSQLCQDTSRHLKQIQGFSDSEDNSKEVSI